MMHGAAPRALVSEAEFLRLPESTAKIELLDGEVVVSPSPSYGHQEIVGRIVVALRAWAGRRKRPITVGQAPLDVRFAPGRISSRATNRQPRSPSCRCGGSILPREAGRTAR